MTPADAALVLTAARHILDDAWERLAAAAAVAVAMENGGRELRLTREYEAAAWAALLDGSTLTREAWAL